MGGLPVPEPDTEGVEMVDFMFCVFYHHFRKAKQIARLQTKTRSVPFRGECVTPRPRSLGMAAVGHH